MEAKRRHERRREGHRSGVWQGLAAEGMRLRGGPPGGLADLQTWRFEAVMTGWRGLAVTLGCSVIEGGVSWWHAKVALYGSCSGQQR